MSAGHGHLHAAQDCTTGWCSFYIDHILVSALPLPLA